MIENWEQYKNLEYYPNRVCACDCGGKIMVKPHHKYQGVPEYISGHNTRVTGSPAKRLEVRKVLSEQKLGDRNPAKRPEVRAKMSASQTGKKRSKKSVEKQVESMKNSGQFKEAMKNRKSPRQGTDTSPQARENMRNGAINRKTDKSYCESRRRGALKFFSIPENRMRRAKQISAQKVEAQYKTGYVLLPRLGISCFYRSSYEKTALLLLDSKIEVSNIQVEKVYIPYIDEFGRDRIYIPDFLVTLKDSSQFLIEVKPKCFVEFDLRDQRSNLPKIKAAQKWVEENNMIFCIWTEDILYNNNGSTTTSLQVIVEDTVATLLVGEGLKV